ncbi:Leucyl-tRNA synthetase [Clostridiaceae bacterium JG1575]|nr:Leucyl-tRNA synthetase [Clostridiaceae bacterium JG1575]
MHNIQQIDQKWQAHWQQQKTFEAPNLDDRPKYYYLIEFPYPSGAGLHVGHCRSYVALDVMARKKRMMGYNVLFPIGWDAFGAPAEQYAIKNKIHPKTAVAENIKTFKGQVQSMGISFDWSREFSTTDPEYYKWTQWQFLKFFDAGMAYKAEKNINWCPSCLTGLSNEDASGGVCERCGTPVVQKSKAQWMLRMQSDAQALLDGLSDTHFQERIKTAQINWIGKSVGAEIDFPIEGSDQSLRVFTTRPDTIYGATFMVIAPEHPLLHAMRQRIENLEEVTAYQTEATRKSEFERTQLTKDKTGVRLQGLLAKNPLSEELIPIFISDYVMMGYGTGAIMAVPAHDQRDYEFAQKYQIPIKAVIAGGDLEKEAYSGEGESIHSPLINGLTDRKEAIERILAYIGERHLGEAKTNFKLQDWVFSRQRFWGEPIPLVHCETCGWVPVPYEELPVRLPDIAEYEPTKDGESPLANIDSFVHTVCPKCGGPAHRETDTMPNWAGSSWYFLRYMDPKNEEEFVGWDAMKYWGKVDWYNGGMEHATRHLLYARFWNHFLYDQGLIPEKEPFNVRVAHGMVLGEDGEKMSKSKGNVINPDRIIKKEGADTLRCYMMFMGDYEKEVSWNDRAVGGARRFLDRVIRAGGRVQKGASYSPSLETLFHKTIQKVSKDIDEMKFNTAISSVMILLNEMDQQNALTQKDYRDFLHLLNPFCPHLTEELNEVHGLGEEFARSSWPVFDEAKTIDEVKEIAVQINGKVRSTLMVRLDDSEDSIKEKALADEKVQKHLAGKSLVKVIVIKGRIVNIVVRG